MNCPDCGTQILDDQQFCRSCGAGLTTDKPRSGRPRVWGSMILLLVFGGLMSAMAGKLFDLKWLIFAGLFIMIGGMFLVASAALLRGTRPRKHKRRHQAPSTPVITGNPTNKLLPIGDNDFIPSVTEGTTNLLKTPAVKLKSEE